MRAAEVGCLRDPPVVCVVVGTSTGPSFLHPFGDLGCFGILNAGRHDERATALRLYILDAYALFVRAL
jgi:hypothetical protein